MVFGPKILPWVQDVASGVYKCRSDHLRELEGGSAGTERGDWNEGERVVKGSDAGEPAQDHVASEETE